MQYTRAHCRAHGQADVAPSLPGVSQEQELGWKTTQLESLAVFSNSMIENKRGVGQGAQPLLKFRWQHWLGPRSPSPLRAGMDGSTSVGKDSLRTEEPPTTPAGPWGSVTLPSQPGAHSYPVNTPNADQVPCLSLYCVTCYQAALPPPMFPSHLPSRLHHPQPQAQAT